jgi:hypothetical protein
MNKDKRQDIVFFKNNQFHSFLQNREGSFSPQAQRLTLPFSVQESDLPERLRSSDERLDQSKLKFTVLRQLADINHDGLPDIITQTTQSRGVFDKSSNYALHLGKWKKTHLFFKKQADDRISSSGIQFDLFLADLNNDHALDIINYTMVVSIAKVAKALFTKKMSMDINFYRFHKNYSKNPDYAKQVDVSFNLKTGYTRYPAIKISDVNGDGLLDLLLQAGEKKLKLHYGKKQRNLFMKRAKNISVPLPKNGELLTPINLNQDAKSDLLIYYGEQDSALQQKQIRVLLSK